MGELLLPIGSPAVRSQCEPIDGRVYPKLKRLQWYFLAGGSQAPTHVLGIGQDSIFNSHVISVPKFCHPYLHLARLAYMATV